jgi:MerR family copper efflux transcriptional regulator
MLNLQLWLNVKGRFMRISELARRTGLSASRIRFYEANDLLPKAQRSDNGYRDYPEGVVATLRLILDAQNLGFSLSEIRVVLAQAGANAPSKNDVLASLRGKLTSLDRHIEEMVLRRRRVVDLIEELENSCQGPK